jgi:Phage integrase family
LNFRVKAWLRAAGLAPLRPHDLRHTAVALWIAAGANPKEVSVRAGHTSVAFTLDRYGHLFEGHDDELRDRLNAMHTQGLRFPVGRWSSCRAARRGPARPQRGQRRSKQRRRPGARPGLTWADGGAPPETRTPNRCLKRAFRAVA